MSAFRQLLGGNIRQFAMVIVLVVEMLLFHFLTGGTALTAQNLQSVISGNAYVLILAMGMVLVIIAGHIDLSVGSVAAVVGIVLAKATSDTGLGMPWWVGILVALCMGAVIGIWHGFWVAFVGVPAFVVTLAGMMLFRGMNQYIGKSVSIPVPNEVKYIGAGFMNWIPPITVGNWVINSETIILAAVLAAGYVVLRLKARRRQSSLGMKVRPVNVFLIQMAVAVAIVGAGAWVFATGRPGTSFPIPGIIVILLFFFYHFLSTKTPLGRGVYAVGGNRVAAGLTGISVKKINFFVMFNSSILAAIAAIVFVGRSTSSTPMDGVSWELDAIASVFIGGASVWGGIGTVGGTIIGALVMAFLNNGMFLMGMGSDVTQMIKGLVLLLAVAFDVISKMQGRPSIIGTFLQARKRLGVDGAQTDAPKNEEKATQK